MSFSIKGKYAEAMVYTDLVEQEAMKQVHNMLNQPITENTKVAMMPDIHAGKGATIGTTIKFQGENVEDWKISPNVVGVDLGCGIAMIPLKEEEIDLELLDKVVSKWIPAGHSVNETVTQKNRDFVEQSVLGKLKTPLDDKTQARIIASLGTLGGGNHYIELGRDETGLLWLSVHSGSRNLGVQVAKAYQEKAEKYLESLYLGDTKAIIAELIQQGQHQEIQGELQKRKEEVKGLQKDLAFLSPEDVQDYLHDSKLAQDYAAENRSAMLEEIISRMGLTKQSFSFDSVHNYVDVEQKTIRKGATSARSGQLLVIPLNMRDGSLICVGKGSEAWNHSAPHGAGRVLSRSAARKELSLEEYQKQMEGVHTSSVGSSTIDEAPNAYKPKEEILRNIKETVTVVRTVKPIWNFKAH